MWRKEREGRRRRRRRKKRHPLFFHLPPSVLAHSMEWLACRTWRRWVTMMTSQNGRDQFSWWRRGQDDPAADLYGNFSLVFFSFPWLSSHPSSGKRQSRMVVFPTLSYPTTINLDLKRGSPSGERKRSSMYCTIFLLPCCRMSIGIIPRPSNEASLMSSTLVKWKRSVWVNESEGEKWWKTEWLLEWLKGEISLWKVEHQGLDDLQHSGWSDLQVSHSVDSVSKRS